MSNSTAVIVWPGNLKYIIISAHFYPWKQLPCSPSQKLPSSNSQLVNRTSYIFPLYNKLNIMFTNLKELINRDNPQENIFICNNT